MYISISIQTMKDQSNFCAMIRQNCRMWNTSSNLVEKESCIIKKTNRVWYQNLKSKDSRRVIQ